MKKRILLVSMLAVGLTSAYGQNWGPARQRTSEIRKDVEVKQAYHVDLTSLRNLLKDAVETGKGAKPVIISLPTAEGKIEKFAVYSNPVMEKSLANRYELGSYVGAGIDDPSKYVRFSTSPTDMESMIIKDGVFQFIEPISADKKTYGVFYKTKEKGDMHGFGCDTEHDLKDISKLVENGKKMLSNVGITNRPTNTKYRTFRMAIAATGEYTGFHGGTVAGAVNAINNTMTRINGVFEKDFGAHFTVQDLPGIIYTDPANDFYNPQAASSLNLQLQRLLTNAVGNGNYDIGHVFHRNAGGSRNGNAGDIGIVCKNPANNDDEEAKGSAFSMSPDPVGEVFDLMAAHEMGHQLGANHSFSMNTEGTGANVEPWGGTTIMGYPGITDDNIQANMDGYFHYKSISQVLNNLEAKVGCGVAVDIVNNTAPVISPLTAYTIPKGTAYYLEAAAADAEGDVIKYTWEQNDSVNELATISGDNGWGYNPQGALARSYFGTASGRRYFPSLPLVMDGILTNKSALGSTTNPGWETVSYIPRTLNYAVTVRDENAQRPMLSSAETTVTVGNDGPFKFNGLTAASVLYNNATNTISWDPANTNSAPYNTVNVKIDYTADNGVTWTDLAASVPNTGSYTVQMPGNLTGTIKLRISALGNVFYAVSPAITVGSAPSSTVPTGVSYIDKEIFKTTARISWNRVPGANTYLVNYKKQGETNWQNASSSTNSIVLANLEDEQNYEVKVAAVINSVTGAFSTDYAFKTKGLLTGVDYCILNSGASDYAAISSAKIANIDYLDRTFRSYKDLSTDLSKTVNLVKGTTYTLETSILSNPSYTNRSVNVSVWIDYNRNGVFETSEKVGQTGFPFPNGFVNITGIQISFTVPATAYSGDKLLRMRIVSKYNTGSLADICGSIVQGAGGIMDLPVKITGTSLAVNEVKDTKSEISIYPNPADTYVEVKNIKGKADYKIYSADGRLVQKGKLDGLRINVAALVKGVYVISITDEANTYSTKLIKK